MANRHRKIIYPFFFSTALLFGCVANESQVPSETVIDVSNNDTETEGEEETAETTIPFDISGNAQDASEDIVIDCQKEPIPANSISFSISDTKTYTDDDYDTLLSVFGVEEDYEEDFSSYFSTVVYHELSITMDTEGEQASISFDGLFNIQIFDMDENEITDQYADGNFITYDGETISILFPTDKNTDTVYVVFTMKYNDAKYARKVEL